MKNICLAYLLCLSALCSYAQSPCISNFCDSFQEDETITHIELKGSILQLAAVHASNPAEQKALEKVVQLRVLVLENQYLNSKKNSHKLIKQLKKERFSTLMQIKEGQVDIDFLIKENDQYITDLVALVRMKNNFVLLSLEGLLEFSDLNDLQFQLEGGNHFKKIPEKRSDIPQA